MHRSRGAHVLRATHGRKVADTWRWLFTFPCGRAMRSTGCLNKFKWQPLRRGETGFRPDRTWQGWLRQSLLSFRLLESEWLYSQSGFVPLCGVAQIWKTHQVSPQCNRKSGLFWLLFPSLQREPSCHRHILFCSLCLVFDWPHEFMYKKSVFS